MPYEVIADLPESVKDVRPVHAQEIFLAACNNAVEENKDPAKRRGGAILEEVARKVAWAAVKNEYVKEEKSRKWQRK